MNDSLLGNPADWPLDPYPGSRPTGNWCVRDGAVHRLDEFDLSDRILLLAYGSNANPVKLAERLGDVVVLESTITEAKAVWSCSRRVRGDVVATIIPLSGHSELCPVLAVTPEQIARIDAWEGAPVRYRREPFWGTCYLADGTEISPDVYIGTDDVRPPLLVDGRPLGLSEYPYDHVDQLVPLSAVAPASPGPASTGGQTRTS